MTKTGTKTATHKSKGPCRLKDLRPASCSQAEFCRIYNKMFDDFTKESLTVHRLGYLERNEGIPSMPEAVRFAQVLTALLGRDVKVDEVWVEEKPKRRRSA